MVIPMKAKSHAPLRWITLPIHQRDLRKSTRMQTKQIILCTLAVITSCAALFVFAPTLLAKEEKPMMLSAMETKFVQHAAESGMGEAKLGELAGKKGSSKGVKSYGMMLTKDHGMANEDLKMLATKKGVTLPEKTNAEMMDTHKKLEAADAASFDKMFITAMVKAHEMDIASFQKASTECKDPDIKKFVDKTLPTLQAHLEMAKELNAK